MSKITKEELTLIQEQDQRKRAILNDMGLLQTQVHTLSHLFAQLNQEIEDNKKVLEDKYGEVNIELSDGSIKPVEDGKN
jgi:hypothetical protein|tara:strand:+ start:287 stop:523 length:237 start_codon:yes stop_codon:yes gene_type:complete